MAAKQYELGSNVLDWYRDFCPGNSFQVVIRPDITFADVVVGMANGVDLNNLIGSDSEIFGNIVVAKLAEITGESYETVAPDFSRARGHFPDATVAAWAAARNVNQSDGDLGLKERM